MILYFTKIRKDKIVLLKTKTKTNQKKKISNRYLFNKLLIRNYLKTDILNLIENMVYSY